MGTFYDVYHFTKIHARYREVIKKVFIYLWIYKNNLEYFRLSATTCSKIWIRTKRVIHKEQQSLQIRYQFYSAEAN